MFARRAFLTKMGAKWQHILQRAPGCPYRSPALGAMAFVSGMPQQPQLPPLLNVQRIGMAGGQAPTAAPREPGAVVVAVFPFSLVLVFPCFQHLQLALLFPHEDLHHENLLLVNLLTNVLGNVWDNPVNKFTHEHDQVLKMKLWESVSRARLKGGCRERRGHLGRKSEERTIFELDYGTKFPSTALCMLEVEKYIRYRPLWFLYQSWHCSHLEIQRNLQLVSGSWDLHQEGRSKYKR